MKTLMLILMAISVLVAGCKPVNPLPNPIPTDAPITLQMPH